MDILNHLNKERSLFMLASTNQLIALIIALISCIISAKVIKSKIQKSQTKTIWLLVHICMIIICMGTIAQITLSNKLNINPVYFEYFIYIGNVFLSLTLFLGALVLTNTKISITQKYALLFIIPILSLLTLWTNDFHHLFYVNYSIYPTETVYGSFYMIYNIYSLVLYLIALLKLLVYSIKNSGFFSKQAILTIIAVFIPLSVNIFSSLGIFEFSIYVTPICFTVTIILFTLSIFKFRFISTTPIALQKIVDKISDSYIVLDENYNITDFNQTFLYTFQTQADSIRGKNLFSFANKSSIIHITEDFKNTLNKIKSSTKTFQFEYEVKPISKVFNVEINNIYSKHNFLGILILFKDITQHKQDITTIQNNQDMLIEQERLASLGQMIGGIAHNLKTPIFSVAGGLEGLSDLINEYDASIDNPSVTGEDMHEIAGDMREWIEKLKGHISYMSDVITTVKGQTVTLADNESIEFSVTELFKRVDILMKHEIKNALATLKIQNNVGDFDLLTGNINSLVQIINNIISNSIEAYGNNYTDKIIELTANRDNSNLIISIKDYGPGISEIAQAKLFKEMITTKGKNGTGLGMFMSYSNIRAHFNGNLSYETETRKRYYFLYYLTNQTLTFQ